MAGERSRSISQLPQTTSDIFDNDIFSDTMSNVLGLETDCMNDPFQMVPVTSDEQPREITEEAVNEFWNSCFKSSNINSGSTDGIELPEPKQEEIVNNVLEHIRSDIGQRPDHSFVNSLKNLLPKYNHKNTPIASLFYDKTLITVMTKTNLNTTFLNTQTEQMLEHIANFKILLKDMNFDFVKPENLQLMVEKFELKFNNLKEKEHIRISSSFSRFISTLVEYIELEALSKVSITTNKLTFSNKNFFLCDPSSKTKPYIIRDVRVKAPSIKGFRNLVALRNFCFIESNKTLPYKVDLLSNVDETTSQNIIKDPYYVYHNTLSWFGCTRDEILDLFFKINEKGEYSPLRCICGIQIEENPYYINLKHNCKVKTFLKQYLPQLITNEDQIPKEQMSTLSHQSTRAISNLIFSRSTKYFWTYIGYEKYRVSISPTGEFRIILKPPKHVQSAHPPPEPDPDLDLLMLPLRRFR